MEYILINIFYFVVRLFSNGSQMDSKYGMNKNVAHRVHLHVSPMFLPQFNVFCDLGMYFREPWQHGIYLFYTIEKQKLIVVTSSTHVLL